MEPNNSPGEAAERTVSCALSELPVPAAAIAAAVRDVVRMKDDWDDALRRPGLRPLVPVEILCFNKQAIDGRAFVSRVLPFLDAECEGGEAALVPIDRTLGTPWSWREVKHNSRRTTAELQAWLLDPERANQNDVEVADVVHIASLGLYIASEGKNRIRFLRDLGATGFPAWVSTIEYPAASRLALYRVALAGREETWAVLDERWVERLLLPGVTTSLLVPYGVAPPEPWRARWPTPIEVIEAMSATATSLRQRGRVDLFTLVARREREIDGERWAEASLLMLQDVRVRWRWWGWTAAAAALCATLATALPADWHPVVWAGLSGVASGLAMSMFGRNLWVRSRLLGHQ